MSERVDIKAAGETHIGMVRSANQDSFSVDEDAQLYIVADGMGGHAGGEIASQMCVEMVASYIDSHLRPEGAVHPDPKLNTTLANAVNHASSKIYEKALEEPNLKGMGTTATVLKVVNDHAYYAHVGDSRLYLIRRGFIYQMTYDHSLVSEQVRAGILTREEAELHHLRNVITRSVGYQEEEDVDASSFHLENEDYLLICSDGLYGKVADRELSNLIKDQQLEAVSQCISLANERGGEDNITAIILKVQVSGQTDR